MFAWTDMLIAVFVGFLLSKIWNLILYTGYAVIVLQELQSSAAKLLFSINQTIYEIQSLKMNEMRKQGRSEKEIQFETKMMDQNTMLLKKAVISSFLYNWPRKYKNILEFYDWDSAMEYVDNLIKQERTNKRR